MRDPISDAHRRTGALLEQTRTLLRGDDRDAAKQALVWLGEVLDAHFEQEDSLYHAAVAALRPEHRAALEGLSEAHLDLRARYAEVTRRLEEGAVAESQAGLEAFVARLRSHEAEEEHLLRSLDESQ